MRDTWRMMRDTRRVLVTGSRDWTMSLTIQAALGAQADIAEAAGQELVVVHGAARTGADAHADAWAKHHDVTCERHPAQWRYKGVYNPQAGLARNRKMVMLGADICLAFIRSGSRGATHCAEYAALNGIPVDFYRLD